LLPVEAPDQPGDGQRAPEFPGEIENRNRDRRELWIALAQRYAVAALLHRLRFGAFAIAEGGEHMCARSGPERQHGSLLEVMARRLRRIVPKQAHAGATLTNVERGRLSRRLDQPAQLGSDRLAEIESALVD